MKKSIILFCFAIGCTNVTVTSEKARTATSASLSSLAPYIAAIKNYFAQSSSLYTQQMPTSLSEYHDAIPVTEYLMDTKKLNLFIAKKEDKSIQVVPTKQWEDVISYQLSPQKKYLFINTTTFARSEGDKESFAIRVARSTTESLGRHFAVPVIKCIDLLSLNEIAAFIGRCIMYECSPNETSLIIATVQKGGKPSARGASGIIGKKRSETVGGEILRYELFDIGSRTIIKTFENIQLLTYIAEDKLVVKYDDETVHEITIVRNQPLSFLQKFLNFFRKQSTINVIEKPTDSVLSYTANYDLKFKTLIATIKNQQSKSFAETISYSVSPQHQYLLINKTPASLISTITELGKAVSGSKTLNNETILFNIADSSEIKIGNNIVTYMLSGDEKHLLFFGSPIPSGSTPESIAKELPLEYPRYQILSLSSKTISSLEETHKIRSAYFSATDNVVLVHEDGMKKEIPLKNVFTYESPLQAVKERGIEAVRSGLPEVVNVGKEMISKMLESAQKTTKEFIKNVGEYVMPPAPSQPAQTITEEQKKVMTQLHQELPPQLQAIVPAYDEEEFFDLPEPEKNKDEDDDEYFLSSTKAQKAKEDSNEKGGVENVQQGQQEQNKTNKLIIKPLIAH